MHNDNCFASARSNFVKKNTYVYLNSKLITFNANIIYNRRSSQNVPY